MFTHGTNMRQHARWYASFMCVAAGKLKLYPNNQIIGENCPHEAPTRSRTLCTTAYIVYF